MTDGVQADFPGLEVRQSGDVTLDEAIDERVADDLGSAETLSLPITLILMLLAFGALIAAGLPVLLAATSVAATIGILAPLSHLVHADSTVTSMIVLIGMAVGVDYSLFYLKREREERAKGHSSRDAVEIAAQTSGHSILVSGGAVICSMAGLFVIGDSTFNSLAVGSIVVVAVAVLGSITVLPALLAKLGRWVDRPAGAAAAPADPSDGHAAAISGRVLGPVTRHPLVALGLSAVVVVLLAIPALGMKTHSANLETLPTSIPEVQTMRDLSAAFPSEGTTADVVVRGAAGQQAEVADGAGRGCEAAAEDTGRFRVHRRAGGGLGGRPDVGAHPGHPVRRVRRPGRLRDPGAARRAGAAGAGRAGRRVRRRRRRRGVAGLRGPPAGAAAARDRLRAAADAADHGARRSAACRSRSSRRCSTWPRSAWRSG